VPHSANGLLDVPSVMACQDVKNVFSCFMAIVGHEP